MLKLIKSKFEFSNLSALARSSSLSWNEKKTYTPLTTIFIDGVEFKLGSTPLLKVKSSKIELIDEIHHEVKDITIKSLLISKRKNATYLWMTLGSHIANLDCTLIGRLQKTLDVIKRFGFICWSLTDD